MSSVLFFRHLSISACSTIEIALERELLFRLVHQISKFVEEIIRIVGAGRGFGVVLDGEGGQFAVAQALEGVVIEVDVGECYDFLIEGVEIDAKTVVLCGDFDFARAGVLHGLVGSPMTKFEFVRFSAQCQAEQLMPQTYSKGGAFADQFADVFDRIRHGFWIARAIG